MIIVFGAINMDMCFGVARLPQPGETVICPEYSLLPGGKAANQAVAALRMGAKVALVSAIGDDAMGLRAVGGLRRAGIITSGVATSTYPTGCAVITRDEKGSNHIVVASGANQDVTADQIPDEIFRRGHFLLTQMEIRPEETFTLLRRAHRQGVKTVLNLAPVHAVPDDVFEALDYLIMNELEATQLCQMMTISATTPPEIAQILAKKYNLTCVITCGADGSVAVIPDGTQTSVPALPIEDIVDTTGAGDCYSGTLAALLYDGKPLETAMRYAAVAASLSCREEGAQPSYAYSGEIESNLDRLPR